MFNYILQASKGNIFDQHTTKFFSNDISLKYSCWMSQTSHYPIPMNCSKMWVNNGDCHFCSLIPPANFIGHLNLTLFKHICFKHFKLPSMRSLSCINVLFVHIKNRLFLYFYVVKLYEKENIKLHLIIIL